MTAMQQVADMMDRIRMRSLIQAMEIRAREEVATGRARGIHEALAVVADEMREAADERAESARKRERQVIASAHRAAGDAAVAVLPDAESIDGVRRALTSAGKALRDG